MCLGNQFCYYPESIRPVVDVDVDMKYYDDDDDDEDEDKYSKCIHLSYKIIMG
jgi:hypothetical protein